MKQTAVEWLIEAMYQETYPFNPTYSKIFEQAKEMEKEQMLDFGEFIIDELAPMAQNREWVEERYNYFKSE
jgi:hypothetical protein